jgi:hypothetical protein
MSAHHETARGSRNSVAGVVTTGAGDAGFPSPRDTGIPDYIDRAPPDRGGWTAEEDAHLVPYLTEHLSQFATRYIGSVVGRSEFAVAGRLRLLRKTLGVGPEKRRALTKKEQRTILEMSVAGVSARKIAIALNRSASAINLVLANRENIVPENIVERRCMRCRKMFKQDLAKTNFFRCDDHRSEGENPFEPGGWHTGYQRAARKGSGK